MSKRDLFSELTTALEDAKAHSQGKLTLRTHTVNDINDLAISPDEIVNIQHTSERTLENWEQGRSAPNGQAITLLKLVQHHPEMLNHIAKL